MLYCTALVNRLSKRYPKQSALAQLYCSTAKKVFLVMGLLKRIFGKKPTSSNDLENNPSIYGGDDSLSNQQL